MKHCKWSMRMPFIISNRKTQKHRQKDKQKIIAEVFTTKTFIHLQKVTVLLVLYTNLIVVHPSGFEILRSHLGTDLYKCLFHPARLLAQLRKSIRDLLLFLRKNKVIPPGAYLAYHLVQPSHPEPHFLDSSNTRAFLEMTWLETSRIGKDSNSHRPSKIPFRINSFFDPQSKMNPSKMSTFSQRPDRRSLFDLQGCIKKGDHCSRRSPVDGWNAFTTNRS